MKKEINIVLTILIVIQIFSMMIAPKAYGVESIEMACAIRLKELGVFKGRANGFELNREATRLEGLVTFIRLIGVEEETDAYVGDGCLFEDVPDWGKKYVNYAYENHLMKGISKTQFGSDAPLTVNTFSAFLLRALEYGEATEDFYRKDTIELLVEIGLLEKEEGRSYQSKPFTRGLLAVLSCRALDANKKDSKERLGKAIEEKKAETFFGANVLELGAYGDGKKDDTSAIQAVLDLYENVYIPDGVYRIDGSKGLRPRSNQVIQLSDQAVLKIIPGSSPFYFLFFLDNVQNTRIEGGGLLGARNEYKDENRSTGAGIEIRSGNQNIIIKNIKIEGFLGGGIHVGGNEQSENILLESVICKDNSNYGIRATNVKDLMIRDSLLELSNGSDSQNGISIEPKQGERVEDISIENTWAMNNLGSGIHVNGGRGDVLNLELKSCVVKGNQRGVSLSSCAYIEGTNIEISFNEENGFEIIRDVMYADFSKLNISSNGFRGLSLVLSEQKIGSGSISFRDCKFLNNSQKAFNKYDGARVDVYDSSQLLDCVEFVHSSFSDDQAKSTQRYGLTVGDGAMLKNIIVETNCIFEGNILGDMISNPAVEMRASNLDESFLNVRNAGALGDGIQDDTDAIQRALLASKNVKIPKGIYRIDVKKGLKVISNQRIVFEEGAVFEAIPNGQSFYNILIIKDVSNVHILGGVFVGDRYEHSGKEGEWGAGIYIGSNSSEIYVKGSVFKGFWGDGIYVGGEKSPEHVFVDSVLCDDNMRSGISVTNVDYLVISNSTFQNTNGKKPQTGINIEPNPGEICKNIMIITSKTLNNIGNGISLLGKNGRITDIEISDFEARENGNGLYLDHCENLKVSNGLLTRNRNFGLSAERDINFADFFEVVFSYNSSRGASLATSNQEKGLSNLLFTGCVFLNNGQEKSNTVDGVRIDLYDQTGYINNIRFDSCQFMDDQKSPTQRFGISIMEMEKVTDIVIENNCKFQGNIMSGIKHDIMNE